MGKGEPLNGFEPLTRSLRMSCSTTELKRRLKTSSGALSQPVEPAILRFAQNPRQADKAKAEGSRFGRGPAEAARLQSRAGEDRPRGRASQRRCTVRTGPQLSTLGKVSHVPGQAQVAGEWKSTPRRAFVTCWRTARLRPIPSPENSGRTFPRRYFRSGYS